MNILKILIFLNIINLSVYSDSLFPVKENNKWGYINLQSELKIPYQFDGADFFCDGLAIVRKKSKYGVINSDGNVVVPIEESEIKIINNQCVIFRKDTIFGVYNAEGKVLLPAKYTNIELVSSNFLILSQNNLKGVFSISTQKIIEPEYSNIEKKFGFFITKKDNQLGVIDTLLNTIFKNEYSNIEILSNEFLLKSKEWWGMANSKQELKIPHEYQAFKILTSELISFKTKKGGWNLYNTTLGKFINSDNQESFTILDKDLIMNNKNHKHGIINKEGNSILPQTFSNIHLNDNLLLVEQAGKWGLHDKKGVVIIPTVHDKLFPFKKNVSVFETPNGKGIINNKGKILVIAKFKDINVVDNNAICTNADGKIEKFKLDAGTTTISKNVTFDKKQNILSPEIVHNHAWMKGAGKKWGLVGHDTLFIPYRFDDIIEQDANTSILYQKVDYRTNSKIYGYLNSNKLIEMVTQKVGLANKATGQLLAAPQFWYIFIEDFKTNDFARVILEGGAMALLNKSGKIIQDITILKDKKQIKYKFDHVSALKNNMYRFCSGCYVNYDGNWENPKIENGKWGYLNANGTIFMDPQYENATDFSNDCAIVQYKGLYGLINTNGNFILKPEHYKLEYLKGTNNKLIKYDVKKEKYGIVNENGKLLTDIKFDKIFPFSDGLARVMISGKYGFIDTLQNVVIPAIYDNANDFSEGMAAVFSKNRWGYIDKSGSAKILPTYITAENFSDGQAVVFKDGRRYFINQDEKTLLTIPFKSCSDFKNGLATILSEDNRLGLINSNGEIVIEPKYQEITDLNSNRYFKLKTENEYKIFDIIVKKFISKKSFAEVGNIANGLIEVKIDNYYNYIDSTGKVIINKKYSAASDFSDGVAKVVFENKTGFISANGLTALDFTFGNVLDFNQGYSFAEGKAKQWKIIDKNGRNITFDQFYNPKSFQNGFAIVQTKNRKFKWVNIEGYFSFGNQFFENLSPIKDSVAKCKTEKWGIAHASGYFLSNPKYDYIGDFSNKQAVIGQYTTSGVFDLEGKKVIDPMFDNIEFLENEIIKVEKYDNIGYYSLTQNNWLKELKK